jgi:hypothetical protein
LRLLADRRDAAVMGVFRFPIENIMAVCEINADRTSKVPSIPLGLFTKIITANPD